MNIGHSPSNPDSHCHIATADRLYLYRRYFRKLNLLLCLGHLK